MSFASPAHRKGIKLYVGDMDAGQFVDCVQMSDVVQVKLYGHGKQPIVTGIIVEHSDGGLSVEDHNRVFRNDPCFVGKQDVPGVQHTGFIQFGTNNNMRHAFVEYYNTKMWVEQSTVHETPSVRARRAPIRDLSYSETRGRYRDELEISAGSMEKLEEIYFTVFDRETVNEGSVQFELLKDYSNELRVMEKLSLAGADYEAFIVAKKVMDGMTDEIRAVKHLVNSIDQIDETNMPNDVLEMYERAAAEGGREEFLEKIREIHQLSVGGKDFEAFMVAREFRNSLPDRIEEGLGLGELDEESDEEDAELDEESEEESETDAEESEEEDAELDEESEEESETLLDQKTFRSIKEIKAKWKEEDDPQFHLMAKQFELNMMYEKLTTKRRGKLAKIIMAGHLKNLDELFFSPAVTKTKKKERKKCQFKNCETFAQSGCGKYCQLHRQNKTKSRPKSLCLDPDCESFSHSSCRGYCWKHRHNIPKSHFCVACNVIRVKYSGIRCGECKKYCVQCKKVSPFTKGGICRDCMKGERGQK